MDPSASFEYMLCIKLPADRLTLFIRIMIIVPPNLEIEEFIYSHVHFVKYGSFCHLCQYAMCTMSCAFYAFPRSLILVAVV